MNCLEMERDIEGLRGKYEKLVAQMEVTNESGEGAGELRMARAKANDGMDALLEKYLPDFAEQNPEVTIMYEQGQKLEDFVYLEAQTDDMLKEKPGRVFGMTTLSDGRLVAVGDAIWICMRHDDGEWSVFDRVDLPPDDFRYAQTVKELKDGRLLVGANGVKACIYKKDHGDWKEDVALRGLHTEWSDNEALAVFAAEELPDGDIAISGEGSSIFIYDGAGEEKEKRPKQEIMWFDKDSDSYGSARAIAGMPGGTILAGGEYDDKGIVRIYQKNGDGEYELVQELKDFHDILSGQDAKVETVVRVSDNEAVVGCKYGNIYLCKKDAGDGEWRLERLEWAETEKCSIETIQKLPDGGFVAGDTAGMMVTYVQTRDGKYEAIDLLSEPDLESRNADIGSMAVTGDGSTLVASRGMGEALLEFYNKVPLDVEKLKERLLLVVNKAE